MAEVVEHLVPEPRVQQVQHRMLDAADVQVDAARVVRAVLGRPRAHPVRLVLLGAQRFRVVRVGVAQLVPRAARPLRHDVGVAGVGLEAVAEIQLDVHPVGRLGQRRRRLAVGVVGVEQHRRVVVDVGQFDRQRRFRQRVRTAVFVVDDRERLAPVPLPGEQPVPQLVLDAGLPAAVGLEPAR